MHKVFGEASITHLEEAFDALLLRHGVLHDIHGMSYNVWSGYTNK